MYSENLPFIYEVVLSCKNAEEETYKLISDDIQGVEILSENEIKIFLTSLEDEAGFIKSMKDLSFVVKDIKKIKNENWTIKCKEFYTPLEIGNLFVTPKIEEEEVILSDKLLNLKIIPGMAFGTGHHETTKNVLKLLQHDSLKENKDKIKSVLDVGAGTCILSIAACMLFNAKAIAFDNDKETFKNATDNILLNNKENEVDFFIGTIEDVSEKNFDLTLANIYAEILIQIYSQILEKSATNSFLILSGIEKTKKNLVLDTYSNSFNLIEEIIDGNWATLLLKRK